MNSKLNEQNLGRNRIFVYLQHVSSKIVINYKTKTSKFIVHPWFLSDLYGLCLNILQGSPPALCQNRGWGWAVGGVLLVYLDAAGKWQAETYTPHHSASKIHDCLLPQFLDYPTVAPGGEGGWVFACPASLPLIIPSCLLAGFPPVNFLPSDGTQCDCQGRCCKLADTALVSRASVRPSWSAWALSAII